QQHLGALVLDRSLRRLPLPFRVPDGEAVRESRRDFVAQEELPFELADRTLRAGAAEVERRAHLCRGRGAALGRRGRGALLRDHPRNPATRGEAEGEHEGGPERPVHAHAVLLSEPIPYRTRSPGLKAAFYGSSA